MEILRTPDEQFIDLPDFPFAPHYVDVPVDAAGEGIDGVDPGDTLRVHYLDEGPADGPVVLLMHGEPSWSFLYRHMIPVLTAAGLHCIAPDLVGLGRSDKPAEQTDHTFARHVAWMRAALFDTLDLTDITLVCQDWGSLIGLRLVGEHPDRFARIVVANGGLPTGDQKMSEAFLNWQNFAKTTEHFPVGAIVNGGCTTDLSPEVIAAYDAPYPDDALTAAVRIFPALGAHLTRRPGRAREPRRVGRAGDLRPTDPDRVQRLGPDHRRHVQTDPGTHPGRAGATAHHHRRWRAFSAGRSRARTGQGRRRLRRRHILIHHSVGFDRCATRWWSKPTTGCCSPRTATGTRTNPN